MAQLLTFIIIIASFGLAAPAVEASSCSWMINASCGDVSGCVAADSESFCDNAENNQYKNQLKQKYSTTKCCCCAEEIGCCSFKNRIDSKTYAKNATKAECYGGSYFADILEFNVTKKADANRCVAKVGSACCACSMSVGGGAAARIDRRSFTVSNEEECDDAESITETCFFKAGMVPNDSKTFCVAAVTTPPPIVNNTPAQVPVANGEVSFEFDDLGSENPLQTFDPAVLAGRVIKGLMVIIGTVAFAITVYAGWLWMTAQGNDVKVKNSQKIIIWMAAGLVLIFMSYVIVKFMLEIVGK